MTLSYIFVSKCAENTIDLIPIQRRVEPTQLNQITESPVCDSIQQASTQANSEARQQERKPHEVGIKKYRRIPSSDTPPTFIWFTSTDLKLANALSKKKRPSHDARNNKRPQNGHNGLTMMESRSESVDLHSLHPTTTTSIGYPMRLRNTHAMALYTCRKYPGHDRQQENP
ncbi:hypothetical protein BDP55DRAFT_635039 [Colletotrichum godetiae]|uniref:Uncharacterized protein n=1 Tax=Colletotrichum godetiae TaxID=1209918 RepID=A0AAJ0EUI6_9PEZI|nr:uncharacterized protein BDP55DRAFT_635039 [Colletotrichum godetiae]KAK1672295.1 hypothetical protein BDP55DRAFT_635039 [Colletotrichum godetiae]